jgi:hypothetical protein
MLKMTELWIEHFVDLLKHLEHQPTATQIHQFRRSFQGGNKKQRLLPQLENMYNKCQSHLHEDAFEQWFNQQKFTLTLGRKNIILLLPLSQKLPMATKVKLMRLFTKWDPQLSEALPPPTEVPTNKNMGFSRKQMRMAMRKLNHMGNQQLSNVLHSMPNDATINEEELDAVFDERGAERIKTMINQ